MPLLWLQIATSCIVYFEPAPTDIIGIGLFLLFFLIGLKVPEKIRTGIVLLCVFLLANLVASLLTPDPVSTLKSLMIRMLMVVYWFYFVCLIYESPRAVLSTIWKGYIAAAVISVTVGLLAFYEVFPALEQCIEFGRVRAFFKDPNVYGPFLVPVAMYSFSRLESANGFKLLSFAALFIFITCGIILGFSRGSWINFFIAMVLYTGIRFKTNRSAVEINRLLKLLGLMLLLLIVAMVIAASSDRISGMLEIRAQVQNYDTEQGGRLSNQFLILTAALTHPLGVGPSLSQDIFFRAPHNIYLHVLIESGWIGALAYYSFLILTIQKGFKFCFQRSAIQASYIVVFTCTIGLLAQSLFIDSTHWRHLYLLLAMLWGPALYWENAVKTAVGPRNLPLSNSSPGLMPQTD